MLPSNTPHIRSFFNHKNKGHAMTNITGILSSPAPKQPKDVAMLLSMIVRNSMEDFHTEHLDDALMKELNQVIRNAIYTGLVALGNVKTSQGAMAFVTFNKMQIPDYWEDPKLLEDLSSVL